MRRKRTLAERAKRAPQPELDVEEVEVNVPVLQIPLEGVNVSVQQQGEHKVVTIGPVALVFQVPLNLDVARQLGGALVTGVEIPSVSIVERVGASKT